MGSVAHTRGEMLYEGSISDGIYLTRATGRRTSSGMMFGNVRIAQSLRWARMNIGLSATMTDNKYKMMTGGKPVPCSLQMANMGADISMQPATWLSADAKSSLTMTRFAGSAIAGGRTMRHFYHNINVYIMPGQWRVEWRNEIFHSNDRSVTSCYFADIAASYSFKRCELGIELNNITGRDTYQSMSITTSRQTLSVNRLRPRELLAGVRFSIN